MLDGKFELGCAVTLAKKSHKFDGCGAYCIAPQGRAFDSVTRYRDGYLVDVEIPDYQFERLEWLGGRVCGFYSLPPGTEGNSGCLRGTWANATSVLS